jgi:glycosyltransferase involved in cell wall biosynthesis
VTIVVSAPISEFPNGVAGVTRQVVARMADAVVHDSLGGGSAAAALRSRQILNDLLVAEPSALYRTMSGGPRALLDQMVVSEARSKGIRTVLHHHSYAYLRRQSKWHAKAISAASGHIVLDLGMAHCLTKNYGVPPNDIYVQNNAFAVEPLTPTDLAGGRGLVVGHMSNLTAEKGVDILINWLDKTSNVQCLLAGPTPAWLAKRLHGSAAASRVTLLGPLTTPREKSAFFESLDLFIFLSRYKFEAQPLVLYEAAAAGLGILATRWAGIPSQLAGYPHARLVDGQTTIEDAIKLADLEIRDAKRASGASWFRQVHHKSLSSLHGMVSFVESGKES